MLSRLRILCVLLFFCGTLSAQITSNDLLRDTIYYRSSFLNRTYLLNGKPLTLPVMAFFMKDYPEANRKISLAQLTDQLCIAGYSVGSLFTIGGLLVNRQNRDLGADLIELGLVGVGTGLIFQIISGGFKVSAVRHYNTAVKDQYRKKTSAIHLTLEPAGVGVAWRIRD